MKKFAKMAVAAAIAGMSLAASAALMIDDFSVDQGVIPASGDTPASFSLQDPSKRVGTFPTWTGTGRSSSVVAASENQIIGFERDVFVERLGGTSTSGNVTASVQGGQFLFSSDAATSGKAIIKWDGFSSPVVPTASFPTEQEFLDTINPTGLGARDLTAFGNAFGIFVNRSNDGFKFALQVFTDATHWTLLAVEAMQHNPGDPVNPILFADFAGAANENGFVLGSGAVRFTGSGGSADLTKVGALMAIINVDEADVVVDFEINDAQVIPEPASLALVGVGLLGLGAIRRRKQRA